MRRFYGVNNLPNNFEKIASFLSLLLMPSRVRIIGAWFCVDCMVFLWLCKEPEVAFPDKGFDSNLGRVELEIFGPIGFLETI